MKADFHIHTSFSCDGLASPKEVVRTALERGIHCICITDHEEIKGAIEVMRAGYDKDILIIPGIEVTSKLGDVLGINVKKKIPRGLTFEETVKEIRKQGGMVVIPHPFSWPVAAFKGNKKDLCLADAIEVFNASLLDFSNKKAIYFSQQHNFPFTAGSDAHTVEFIGKAYLEIPEDKPIAGPEDILTAIRNREGDVGGIILPSLKIVKDHSKRLFIKLAKNGLISAKKKT